MMITNNLVPKHMAAWHRALLPWTILACLTHFVIGAELPLEVVVPIDDQTIGFEQRVELPLPALPFKADKRIVLRCRIVSYTSAIGGCNLNARVEINGSPLGRRTATGTERLIGRKPFFELASDPPGIRRLFQIFSGSDLMVLFAPDVDTGDQATVDGQGSRLLLDISDLVRGVDGNMLTIRNTRAHSYGNTCHDLIVRQIEIGYLERIALPVPKYVIPSRSPIQAAATVGSLQLRQGKAGGFSVTTANGLELLVETTLAMHHEASSDLTAADAPPEDARATVRVEQTSATSFRAWTSWERVALQRSVAIRAGLIDWTERWTNTSARNIGVPFRHRLFLRDGTSRFVLAGDPDVPALASSPANPTLLIESTRKPGMALGVTAESDWLRLLMSMRGVGGMGEIYSRTLALAPGKSVDLHWTITPVDDGGGYWSFINRVRQRWGVNRTTVPRPIFWTYAPAPDVVNEKDRVAKSLGHLGPIILALGPWGRLEPDAKTVRSGNYPKLPTGAAPAPGKCPDLDVDAFLTFAHRRSHQEAYQRQAELIRKVCPNVRVIQLMHPAMEAVYRPLAHRWPWHGEGIMTPSGTIFAAPRYSKAWLYGSTEKDWSVLYYVPRPGSPYLEALLESVRQSMEEHGSDGIYFDEFSWGGRNRGYSRYDYSRWDQHSADLNEQGEVLRLKSDNAHATETAQLQLARATLARGGFFLANGAASLRSVNRLPIARFIEGGNGHGVMASGHLSMVPMVLGNLGDQSSRQGLFEAVKQCLSIGCIYSPTDVNLLLDGPDNFVCKLYPITIRQIGAHTIFGQQRLITARSGAFDWPGSAANVRLYEYDRTGNLTASSKIVHTKADAKLTVNLPQEGLVIAEIISPPTAKE